MYILTYISRRNHVYLHTIFKTKEVVCETKLLNMFIDNNPTSSIYNVHSTVVHIRWHLVAKSSPYNCYISFLFICTADNSQMRIISLLSPITAI